MSTPLPNSFISETRTVNVWANTALVALCALVFIDIDIPLVGSSNRLVAILVLPLLLLGRSTAPKPFCIAAGFLLPFYYLLPPLIHFKQDAQNFQTIFVYSIVALAAVVLLADLIARDSDRARLVDVFVVVAVTSAVLAILQRYGIVDALGRDRWGYAVTANQSLRGAGFLADPNFLATILASVVPLVVNWRVRHLRWPALAVIAFGINSTDSRAGIILGLLAFTIAFFMRVPKKGFSSRTLLPRIAVFAGAVAIGLLLLNYSGQRDRVITGVLIGVGLQDLTGYSADPSAELSALNRREAVAEWIDLGYQSLPFGAGVGAEDRVDTQTVSRIAAHNSFVSAFGQGGIAGLLLNGLTLFALLVLIKERHEPLAMMGIIVVLGGLFLSYPGSPFFLLPFGIADGVRAAGTTKRYE